MNAIRAWWPLSKDLLREILNDRVSDCFVTQLIWERLGYQPGSPTDAFWQAGPETPQGWSEKFPRAPEVITQRKASVALTRSIPKKYKQLLKKELDFNGYRIGELFPRRTRRATAVNWLMAWQKNMGYLLVASGPMPSLLDPPIDPVKGHPGDPQLE